MKLKILILLSVLFLATLEVDATSVNITVSGGPHLETESVYVSYTATDLCYTTFNNQLRQWEIYIYLDGSLYDDVAGDGLYTGGCGISYAQGYHLPLLSPGTHTFKVRAKSFSLGGGGIC